MYKSLSNHLPPFLQENQEFVQIMQTEDEEIHRISTQIARASDNSFAEHADDVGLERWEKMFGIVPLPGSRSHRRLQEVLVRLADGPPYTKHSLDVALTSLFGNNGIPLHIMFFEPLNFSVRIELALALENSLESIRRFLELRLPANMVLQIVLLYLRHNALQKFRYGELSLHTYLQIRRGEFD
jgi:hypothetical protein